MKLRVLLPIVAAAMIFASCSEANGQADADAVIEELVGPSPTYCQAAQVAIDHISAPWIYERSDEAALRQDPTRYEQTVREFGAALRVAQSLAPSDVASELAVMNEAQMQLIRYGDSVEWSFAEIQSNPEEYNAAGSSVAITRFATHSASCE